MVAHLALGPPRHSPAGCTLGAGKPGKRPPLHRGETLTHTLRHQIAAPRAANVGLESLLQAEKLTAQGDQVVTIELALVQLLCNSILVTAPTEPDLAGLTPEVHKIATLVGLAQLVRLDLH